LNLEKLEDMADRAAFLRVQRAERAVPVVLKSALNDIRGIMAKTYERYAVNGVLTKAEMTRYNRMASLEAQVLEALDPALRTVAKNMERLPPDAYNEAFFRYGWAIDNAAGVRLNYGMLNVDAVKALLANPFDWKAKKLWPIESRLLMQASLAKGLPIGKSFQDMAKDLKAAINTTASKAMRIVRTEGISAINAGQDAAYKKAVENGVEGRYVWDATLDGRTRPSHGAMDGQYRDEDTGYFAGPGGERAQYPADPNLSAGERINCRCRLRFEIDGYAPILRRQRDGGIQPYQTYEQWSKS
jgi:SPP1 gp7 family putative phage head morphogenesis protein